MARSSPRSIERNENTHAHHYVEARVHASEKLVALQRELKRENPNIVTHPPEKLHLTLGYFGSREETLVRLRAKGVEVRENFFSVRWAELLSEVEHILAEPVMLYFNHKLELFDKSSVVLVVNERQGFTKEKIAILDAYLDMIMSFGLTREQAIDFMKEGKQTKYLDAQTSRYHVTIAKVPKGAHVDLRPVSQVTAWTLPSSLRRRMKS